MPLSDAQPDALCQSYARALFELCMERGGRDHAEAIGSELEEILELARADAGFNEFLASRVVGVKKRREALQRILGDNCSELTLQFLLLLNRKDRLGRIMGFVAAFDSIVQHELGRIEVDIFTASPLDPSEIDAIRDQIADAVGKDVVPHPYTDPAMIGGVKLRIGDRLIDASLATRLRRVREQLGTRAVGEVRSRLDRIIDISGD
jgi:F-type H+-transporting ATPase subunit delta